VEHAVDEKRFGCAEEQVDDTKGLWIKCTAPLRAQVPATTWQMWLSSLEPRSYDGRTMVLSVPNAVVRERVEGRFLPMITDVLAAAAGHPVRVRLEVAEPAVEGRVIARGGAREDVSHPAPPAPVQPPLPMHARPVSEPRVGAAVTLDARFTFDTFVAASSNRLAHAAAQAVAETPGRSYNPLFIYGDSGLGKTHLLHAIGNYVQENFTSRTVLYVTTETFMNDFVDALRKTETIAFKRRYRECDVLLIDDVQFMENKEGLQEEFFHTYNDLHGAGKQIVLTSDRPPKSIETLEDRLRSRFLSGLITEVDPPDLETRLAILRKKAEADRDDIPDDVLGFIATHVKNNIRELEGALIRVSAFASLSQEPISLDLAEHVLADIVSSVEPRPVTPQMILEATAASYGFTVEALCGPSRTRPLVTARQVAMYLVRNLTDYSYPAIARVFGGRDHTTVIHAVDKISTHMKERRQLYEQVTDLTVKIRGGT
jgi:chromosomal replication initiator protein